VINSLFFPVPGVRAESYFLHAFLRSFQRASFPFFFLAIGWLPLVPVVPIIHPFFLHVVRAPFTFSAPTAAPFSTSFKRPPPIRLSISSFRRSFSNIDLPWPLPYFAAQENFLGFPPFRSYARMVLFPPVTGKTTSSYLKRFRRREREFIVDLSGVWLPSPHKTTNH